MPKQPTTTPSAIISTEPPPITFMHRHMPTPKSKVETMPKVNAKMFAGFFAFASKRFSAFTF